ncbi:unnamed protein product [Lupinus luteus]|uniref:Palmitoyl-protein thioesterase 1-like n=1 Tax=Lupinus luteus TaxID=3873 RepID=A0AAV1WYU7_LUPLU
MLIGVIVQKSTQRQIHNLHFQGIADQCDSAVVKNITDKLISFSGVEGYCVEVGNGYWDSWLMPMLNQTKVVCEKVKKMKELKDGYNIVGISQGTLIARGVVEFCDGGPPVKNFISISGPHAGTTLVPLCKHLAPSGYLKLPDAIPAYLDKCEFLPLLNNELPDKRNSTYKERFSSLQNLVLIMSEEDGVLIPKETAWFGYYPDGASSPVLPPQQTKLYTEDWIGLRTLDEAGRVKFFSFSGGHVEFSDTDIKKYVVPYLKDQALTEHSTSK